MKVTVESAGACRRVLHIEVPQDTVAEEYDKVVSAFVKAAKIPGFRPGRAPSALVEKRFARSIAEETRDALRSRGYQAALAEQNLTPVAIVNAKDGELARDQDFTFRVTVDVRPEFELPAYRGIPLAGESTEVSDAQVDGALERCRENMAEFSEIQGRAVQAGDLALIDYHGTCGGQPVGELAAECAGLGEGKDFWMMIQSGEGDFLPGLSDALVGAQADEEREVTVTFPADFRVRPLAGREAHYRVTVKAIREKKLPDVDEAFLQVYGAQSLDQFRDRLRQELARAREAAETRRLKNEIVRWVLSETRLEDLPQSLVEQETHHIVRDIVYENVARGVTSEEIQEHKDDIFTMATQSSGERVKLSYILGRMAREENIEVTDEDLSQRIHALAQRRRADPAKLRAELAKRGALDAVRNDIRSEKTLDFLLAHAKIEPAEPATDREEGDSQ